MERVISRLVPLCAGLALAACSPEPTAERSAATDAREPTDTPAAVPSFADLDRDGDGFLSPMETQAIPELREIFALADNDQDGRLSVAEFSQATLEGFRVSPEAARGPLFPALDADGDGEISAEEARAVPQVAERFDDLDRDGSGGLDSDEYLAAAAEGFGE